LRALAVLALVGAAARADEATLLPHPADTRWWLSGQLNVIAQAHPAFPSTYQGPNSLRPDAEAAVSFVVSLYSGYRVTDTTELYVDVEAAGGHGLSEAVGLGGITNLDVVRNPYLGSTPYLARAVVRQIVPLGDDEEDAPRGPHQIAARLPVRRLDLRAGKLSTVDSFDVNGPGSDSHLQFMNWTACNGGAYDYAADTRGYTLGAVVEYHDALWSLRFGELLMPTVANGIDYDFDWPRARADNLEVEVRPGRGVYRLLGFWNHANMGHYDDAATDITLVRAPGRAKFGLVLGGEHEVLDGLRLFGRLSWNDGQNESFAYTEVDDSVEIGADWRAPRGKVGLAAISNGLSGPHRDYLARGGAGFLLGDGALRYGREWIVESYYTLPLGYGVAPAADVQLIADPGYNADRGPVAVFTLRLHVDI
jgi:hypothetical protein